MLFMSLSILLVDERRMPEMIEPLGPQSKAFMTDLVMGRVLAYFSHLLGTQFEEQDSG